MKDKLNASPAFPWICSSVSLVSLISAGSKLLLMELLLSSCALASSLRLLHHPVLHLIGSLVCERDCKNMSEIIGFSQDQPEVSFTKVKVLPEPADDL